MAPSFTSQALASWPTFSQPSSDLPSNSEIHGVSSAIAKEPDSRQIVAAAARTRRVSEVCIGGLHGLEGEVIGDHYAHERYSMLAGRARESLWKAGRRKRSAPMTALSSPFAPRMGPFAERKATL